MNEHSPHIMQLALQTFTDTHSNGKAHSMFATHYRYTPQ